jgi:hypothetical protein
MSHFKRNEAHITLGAAQNWHSAPPKGNLVVKTKNLRHQQNKQNATSQNKIACGILMRVTRSKVAHQFTLTEKTSARRRAENPLEGGEHRYAQ